MGVFSRSFRAPVTTFVLIALATVFAGTQGDLNADDNEISEARQAWGSVERLTWVTYRDGRAEVWHDDLYGPFDVWDGEWWRVPLSSLHHAGLLHLFLNSLFLAVYGPLLERTWGHLRYGVFLIAAAAISMLPEYLLQHEALGFSGACCAIYGALWAMRESSPAVAALITSENVIVTLVVLVAMAVMTELGVLQIANAAHFTGLGYGYVAGWISGRAPGIRGRYRMAFVLSHGLVVVPMWLIVHPAWEGRYEWYLATRDVDGRVRAEADMEGLERAVALDPTLSGIWQTLVRHSLAEKEPLRAWGYAVRGLSHCPSDAELWKMARRLWRRLVVSPDRAAAQQVIMTTLGEQAEAWLAELRRTVPPPVLIAPGVPPVPTYTELPESDDALRRNARPSPYWRPRVNAPRPLTPGNPLPGNAMEGRAA